jgi:membrane-associated protein
MLEIFNAILHIDVTLAIWVQNYGHLIYFILFLIIFCETGLVGALASTQPLIKIYQIIPLLILAASLGDSLNYFIGKKWGVELFNKNIGFLNPKYLKMTEEFFQKKGVWAVSLSRFFPIIRTFAPFFAGLSKMPFSNFIFYSVFGSIGWVNLFVIAGFYFGQIEIIQKNFTYLIMGIVFISMVPFVVAAFKSKFLKKS